MPKRSRKPADLNRLASSIVDETVGDVPKSEAPKDDSEKDPAAVALGRKGGLKGGKARAAKLSATERSESARHAATTRWKSQKSQTD